MKLPPIHQHDGWSAWRRARLRLRVTMAVVLVIMAIMAVDRWRADHAVIEASEQVMTRLHLWSPAIWPAGSGQRHPELVWPGMALDLSPQSTGPVFDVAGMTGCRSMAFAGASP